METRVMQIIEKDWNKTIDAYVLSMEHALAAAQKHPPGPEFESAYDSYDGLCQDFLDHLSKSYGSAEGFTDFLKSDAREKLVGAGLSTGHIEQRLWETASIGSNALFAEDIGRIYKISYCELIENIAHHKATHHAALPQEFNNG